MYNYIVHIHTMYGIVYTKYVWYSRYSIYVHTIAVSCSSIASFQRVLIEFTTMACRHPLASVKPPFTVVTMSSV